jgi:uncharacterized protein YodC (DUF2158 family)
MSESKFKVGDVVTLKSDKQNKMTVNEIKTETTVGDTINENFNGFYECIWFDVTIELRKDDFKEDVLELYEPN